MDDSPLGVFREPGFAPEGSAADRRPPDSVTGARLSDLEGDHDRWGVASDLGRHSTLGRIGKDGDMRYHRRIRACVVGFHAVAPCLETMRYTLRVPAG